MQVIDAAIFSEMRESMTKVGGRLKSAFVGHRRKSSTSCLFRVAADKLKAPHQLFLTLLPTINSKSVEIEIRVELELLKLPSRRNSQLHRQQVCSFDDSSSFPFKRGAVV
jgi:hypothetical protein